MSTRGSRLFLGSFGSKRNLRMFLERQMREQEIMLSKTRAYIEQERFAGTCYEGTIRDAMENMTEAQKNIADAISQLI